ncbi:hypothetical protein G6F42_017234 [Rhizopus arrhizus]|nr:hypothetical protein G6F42_017234 [Rhizopus arrhizus]
MAGNTPNPNNHWALEVYYPQPTAPPANQEEMLKVYVQQAEEENHNLKQRNGTTFQDENLTLHSSINKLQNENAELLRSEADEYQEMRAFFNKKHHREASAVIYQK